jgi:hypothetical protein
MKPPVRSQHDLGLVIQFGALVSIASFFYYLRHGDLLLYGDAVAHINIARRVFDSRTPGPLQLGTVWLPLPHLLMMPFLVSRWLWQTGIAGSIPSMLAYVSSVAGIFRLVQVLLAEKFDHPTGKFTAWLAAAAFALNANLVYLQTTAMTEPLYLAFFIWAMVFFCAALRGCEAGKAQEANSSLVKAGLAVAAACLTRYDGWFLAAVLSVVGILLAWAGNFSALRPGVRKFVLLAGIAPALWLAYNAAVYRNPLEFANGPYSARAIEQKTSVPGFPPHPGANDLALAFKYFFKSAELNQAPGKLQIFWVGGLLLGTAIALLFQRKLWPAVLLWVPVPFYMLSIAYGGVPIFIPVWWPFSYYNARYGIQLLPAFAVLTAIAAYGLMRFAASTKARLVIGAGFLVLIGISYVEAFSAKPVSYQEAVVNSHTRIALESQLASILKTLPSDSTFLMYVGDHVGTFQRAGIPLWHVINEGNHRPWKRPTDPEGLWERALAHPASYADFVIAFDNDAVASAVNKAELDPFLILHIAGQPRATLFRTVKSNQPR